MESFLFILAIPILLALFARIYLNSTITTGEMFAQLGITLCVTIVLWFAGSYVDVSDVEIRNGKIISKHVVKDQYTESYQCNCRQQCSGSGETRSCYQICSTCYREHYTKTWFAKSTVGDIRFDHVDSLSKNRAWSTPDPKSYINCVPGEPASREFRFTNYVKAVPESLFNNKLENTEFQSLQYPSVHSFYKINRVIDVNNIADPKQVQLLNKSLNESLKELGPNKQVNIVVIVTDDPSPSYKFSVENDWLGGKKNDVIVFFGLSNNEIMWVDSMTWALNKGNENLHNRLNADLRSIKQFNANQIHKALVNNINLLYDRPQMSDFEYLKDDINPPVWLVVTAVLLNLIGGAILIYIFHKRDF